MQDVMLVRIVKYFLENPYKAVYLRELARALKISPYTGKQYIDLLVREGLILEERKAKLRYVRANASNLVFKHLKIVLNLKKLADAGLVQYVQETVSNVSSVMLFGSVAKGEDTAESDIDLMIIGGKVGLDMHIFERTLGREMRPHVYSWSEWKKKAEADKPFYYEVVIHGIALFGEPPVIK